MNALPLFDGIGRCAAPASLAEMRAATETGLRRLQGEAEPSGGGDYTVIAADGYRIAARLSPCEENRRRAAGNAVRPRRRLVPRFAGAVRSVLSGAGQRHRPGDPVSRLPSGAGIPVSAAAGRCLSGALLWRNRRRSWGSTRSAWRWAATAPGKSGGGGRAAGAGSRRPAHRAPAAAARRSAARWRRRAIASLPRGTF